MNNNLDYCNEATKKAVNFILESPVTRDFTKEIIRKGLTKDCVDAVSDSMHAAGVLQMVLDDINR